MGGLPAIQEARELYHDLLREQLLTLDDEEFATAHAYVVAQGQPSGKEKRVFVEVAIERDRRGRANG
jgi:hypothetical protein